MEDQNIFGLLETRPPLELKELVNKQTKSDSNEPLLVRIHNLEPIWDI